MNFVFISPNFPGNYYHFCEKLLENGVNVLGIGDAPYETLSNELRFSLTEYYKVDSLEDYDQMIRAIGFFTFKYGKIDWIESNNEFWLSQDAKLRVDFNVHTGFTKQSSIAQLKKKSQMKEVFAKASIPSAKSHMVDSVTAGKKFAHEVGYPVIVSADYTSDINDVWKLNNDDELEKFYKTRPAGDFIMEEFIDGDVYSYDAIIDDKGNALFESTTRHPSVLDTVMSKNEFSYFVYPDVPEELTAIGQKTAKAFDLKRRFVHFEFIRMEKAKKNLGKKNDFIAVKVSACPSGGPTCDMMNYAHSSDVYEIWANMMIGKEQKTAKAKKPMYSVYAFRRGNRSFAHTNRKILQKYNATLAEHREVPPLDWEHEGEYSYIAVFDTLSKAQAFLRYISERRK